MAVDPYVKRGGIIPRKSGGITRNIGGLAEAIRKVKAGDTSGLGNSNNNYAGGGSGGGAVAAAPTALDSLPKTPEIQALIAKGLLRADMAPEQILAIVGMAGQVAGIPIDIAALKAQLAKDYETTTGGILGMGADWMQQMFGANMPDGNAAAYAADPMFAQYAAGLGQQQATAGLNQATDQAWFDKQQQAMTDYYNGLMQSIAMGAGTTGGGGGGGGGGGRRHGYGGGGGGGSGGDGDWGFTDPVTTSTQTEQTVAKSSDRESQMWPDYKNEVYDAAVAQFGVDDPRTQYVLDTLDTTTGPDPALEQVANDMTAAQTTIENRNALDENNQTWTQAAPANFEQLRSQYEQLTGQTLGDDPNTDEFEWQRPTEGVDQSGINLATIAPGSIGAQIIQLMDQAYDPANLNALYGLSGGTNEGFNNVAELFNRVLNAKNERQTNMEQALAQQIAQAVQNRINPVNGKGLATAGVGSSGPGTGTYQPNASPGSNPYTNPIPGAYSPPSSANTGSISGGPGTSQLTPETVANGTYVPALNQTDQAANVSPYDSDLGRPLQNLYEQLAQQGDPHTVGGVNPSDSLDSRPAIVSDPALADPVYSSDLNRPYENLMAQLGQTGGIPAGAGIDQLPPEIIQAAMQTTGGPPGIMEINHALLQAGLPLLDSSGHLTDAIPGYGPSGNSRPMLGGNALLGMPMRGGDFTKPGGNSTQQAAMSKLAPSGGRPTPTLTSGEDSAILTALVRALGPIQENKLGNGRSQEELAQLIADANGEGPITGGTIYDQIIGNVAVTPQTTDQFGRLVPSKLREDLLGTMQQLSGAQKVEALRGLADANMLPQGEGQYYEAPTPELSGDALADAQMVNILAPGLRDMIREHSTLWDMNPYSRHVDNTGTSTQQLQTKQKSYDPDVANAVAAGNLNDFATVPDLITQPFDQTGQPIFTDGLYQGAPPGDIVDVNLPGGGGMPGGLKSMAIRRIAQPTAKAPLTSGKSKLKAGTGKTYTKGGGKKSYVTNTKTIPYTPKNKKKYSK